MQLKSAISVYLQSKEKLTSYPTYKSCSQYLNVTVNLKTIDLAGDLLSSERIRRIRKTKEVFEKVSHKLQGKSKNTKFFTINMLKSVLKMVEDIDGSRFWNAYPVSQELKDIEILDVEFAKKFVTDPDGIYETLSPDLKALWEMSVVMLSTTLRFSDAKIAGVVGLNDGRITSKNLKTGAVTSCPVPQVVIDRLAANGRSLYSKNLSKDKCYRLLPKLFALYPEMEGMTHVKFHIFRKSAISYMLAMGTPQSIVMRASGHSVGSKAFARYVGHVETMFNNEISKFQKKFYG